jgi:hypothetical protein
MPVRVPRCVKDSPPEAGEETWESTASHFFLEPPPLEHLAGPGGGGDRIENLPSTGGLIMSHSSTDPEHMVRNFHPSADVASMDTLLSERPQAHSLRHVARGARLTVCDSWVRHPDSVGLW